MKHWIAALSLLTAYSAAQADELEISLSDKSIDGVYESYYSNNLSTQISLMHTDVDNVANADVENRVSYFIDEDSVQTDMAGFGLYANGKYANVKTHLGGKVFYLDSEHGNDVYGIAMGGAVDAYVRRDIFFTGQILYAPDIITGGDFENYWELNARASFQVIKNANIYLGYKNIGADFEKRKISFTGGGTDTRDFFSGVYVGFRFSL